MRKRELLFSVTRKDLIVETFYAGGKGGSNQNKRKTGVRVKHPASGAVGEGRNSRSQHQNKQVAFTRMREHPRFRVWLAEQIQAEQVRGNAELEVESSVASQMQPDNLLIEVWDTGRGGWTEDGTTGQMEEEGAAAS